MTVFPPTSWAPLLVFPGAVFAAFFLAVSLYSRLDFTITKDERWREERAKEKARGILQQLLGVWESEWQGGSSSLHSAPRALGGSSGIKNLYGAMCCGAKLSWLMDCLCSRRAASARDRRGQDTRCPHPGWILSCLCIQPLSWTICMVFGTWL
jgi:hypothetical protein